MCLDGVPTAMLGGPAKRSSESIGFLVKLLEGSSQCVWALPKGFHRILQSVPLLPAIFLGGNATCLEEGEGVRQRRPAVCLEGSYNVFWKSSQHFFA